MPLTAQQLGIAGRKDQFVCVGASALISSSYCITGDGKVFYESGIAIPGGEMYRGQMTNTGGKASDLLAGMSYSVSMGEGAIAGSMWDLGGDSAVYVGVGIGPPIGAGATFGVLVDAGNYSNYSMNPFDWTGG